VGLLVTGWRSGHVVEGLVNHHLVRHARDDVVDPRWGDLGCLGCRAALLWESGFARSPTPMLATRLGETGVG
jgi:hypothetical protein